METLDQLNSKPTHEGDNVKTICTFNIVNNCLIYSNCDISINLGIIKGIFSYANYIQNFSEYKYNGEYFEKILLYCDINNIKLTVIDNYYVCDKLEYKFNFIDSNFNKFLTQLKNKFIIL